MKLSLQEVVQSTHKYAQNLWGGEVSLEPDGVSITLVDEDGDVDHVKFVKFGEVEGQQLICLEDDDGPFWITAHGQLLARLLFS